MPAHSAGILLYRHVDHLEVLLVHPGGPFWVNKDDGAWSVPKGEYEPGAEDPLATARREFEEETGFPSPHGHPIDLGSITQKAGKEIRCFALEGDLDADSIRSNTFEMEWPPRSGGVRSFPEVDRAEWFSVEEARRKLNPAQTEFVERLVAAL